MDIYGFIRSRDVAAHCSEINKIWNTYEMAAIINLSDRPMNEKHAAWQELIDHYPDISVTLHCHVLNDGEKLESIHQFLAEIMEGERRTPDRTGKSIIDFGWGFVDIPVPFKRGDILVSSYYDENEQAHNCFVLDSLDRDNEGRFAKYLYSVNYRNEGWGLFVNDLGALYGDHVADYDSFEYYRGKLEGKYRLLHYVSLYLKNEIGLPAMLNMQCRIIAEHLLNTNFNIDRHGCFIPEYLLAENRLTPDERKKIEETNGLMPWVEGKLTMRQVEFLAEIMDRDIKTMQLDLGKPAKWFLGRCAGIVHDENHYEKTSDARFNSDRRIMARSVLEAYGWTEAGWVDKHADKDSNNNGEGGIPMPNYALLDTSD